MAASDRHTSGITTALIARYVRAQAGEEGLAEVLYLAGSTRSPQAMEDETAWSTYDEKIALLEAAARVLDDPIVARHIGHTAIENRVGAGLKLLLRALGSPGSVLRNVSKAASKFSTVCTMKTTEVSRTRAVVTYRLHDGFRPHRMDCDLNIGLLSQVPVLFGLPPATVSHDQCQVTGADACVYTVKWMPRGAPWSRRRRRVAHLEDKLSILKDRTTALQSSIEDLVSTDDVDTVLTRICTRAAATVGAHAYLLVVNPIGGWLPLIHHEGLTDEAAEALAEKLVGSTEPPEEALVADVASGRHRYGILAALYPEGGEFFPEEHELLRAYARHAAVALDVATALDDARQRAEENEYLALHDGLTGLPNRTLFQDRLKQAIAESKRDGTTCAVLIMDLDSFKEINDTLGHHHGDRILQHLARRLRATLREADTVARLGGDEFGLLLRDVAGPDAVRAVAEQIHATLEAHFVVEDLSLSVEGTLGGAIYPEHGDEVSTLIQRADIAMYVAKRSHTGFELYDADEDRSSAVRLALAGELRGAIRNGQVVVHYQAIRDLRSGRVVQAEALARWDHPYRGRLEPEDFVPVAEHSGLIKPLTMLVLDSALHQCALWNRAGLKVRVAVNLSVRSLLDSAIPAEIEQLLSKWGVAPDRLVLEITESGIVADPPRAVQVLERLGRLGVLIAIDDFGTGNSSLKHLKRLPVHQLKIDRSFVGNMLKDGKDATIVHSVIDLAKSLGITAIAEGIETNEHLHRLLGFGCAMGQGFHLARPMAGDELTPWLLAERERDAESQETRAEL